MEDAGTALVPYSSRPSEMVQCRGFKDALTLQAPTPSKGRPSSDAMAALQDLLRYKFDGKDDLVVTMKKLTIWLKTRGTVKLNIPHSHASQPADANQPADASNVANCGLWQTAE